MDMDRRRKRKRAIARRVKAKENATNAQISSTEESQCLISYLPSCLIMDILSRLPLLALYSCRCVCRTWLRLISDPHFFKLQLQKSPTSFLIVPELQDDDDPERFELVQLLEDGVTSDSSMVFLTTKLFSKINLPPVSHLELVNSCYGLLCAAVIDFEEDELFGDCIYVCNPVLGEYITIPVPNTETKFITRFALGFASTSNQFKVLHTFYPDENIGSVNPLAEIYTVGTAQWREAEIPPCSINKLGFDTFLHGSLHWIDEDERGPDFIYAFNFETERFGQFSFPPQLDTHYDGFINLGLLNGRLCVSTSVPPEREKFDIWVMEEYGIDESWCKHFVIENMAWSKHMPCEHLFYGVRYWKFYQPMIFLESGRILMFFNQRGVVCYYTETKSFQDTGLSLGNPNIAPTSYIPCFNSLQDVAKGEQIKILRRRARRRCPMKLQVRVTKVSVLSDNQAKEPNLQE